MSKKLGFRHIRFMMENESIVFLYYIYILSSYFQIYIYIIITYISSDVHINEIITGKRLQNSYFLKSQFELKANFLF